MRVIIINPQAKQLRSNKGMGNKIKLLFKKHAHIIDSNKINDMISKLNNLINNGKAITQIFVVGGDGTFHHLINWVLNIPACNRPALMSVGGGQFCFMSKHHKLKTADPLRNLKEIFSNKINITITSWRPISIHDSKSGSTKYAAVVANGILSDLVKWYEETGKGNILYVCKMVVLAIMGVLIEPIRKWHGKLKMTYGTIFLDKFKIPKNEYAGFTACAVDELITFCKPFKGTINDSSFYTLAYWGRLKKLALSSPFLYFGKIPFWSKTETFNEPIEELVIHTKDGNFIFDGDIYSYGTGQRKLIISRGPEIHLLTAY